MAKKSKVVKELKRQALVAKYAVKRKELKEQGDYMALQKLPRDSSATRQKIDAKCLADLEVICANLMFPELYSANWRIKARFRVLPSRVGK